jgi:hypothetical protein
MAISNSYMTNHNNNNISHLNNITQLFPLPNTTSPINLNTLTQSTITHTPVYAPINLTSTEDDEELNVKHASEPFKNLSDIKLICDYLLSSHHYRNTK